MRSVLATDLAIWPVMQNIHEVSDAMLASKEIKAAIANYIILYDQIFIPTGNLQIISVLRLILGEGVFDELVKNSIFVLARYDQWISYMGNGKGLNFFSMAPGPISKEYNIGNSYYAPLDNCVDIALKNTYPLSSSKRKQELTNLLLDHVIPVAKHIDNKVFRNETYKDISESPYLRNFFSYSNRGGRTLDNLRGIKKDQLKIYSPHLNDIEYTDKSPEIWSVLHAGFENFVLGIGSELNVNEITGDHHSLALLKAKGQRVGMPIEGRNAFTEIQNIEGVPDIGSAFANNVISSEQLLDLRESKHSESLRNWFANSSPEDAKEDIIRNYVELIGTPRAIESIPAKIIRFASTTGIGAFNAPAGVVASALDNFLLTKLFPHKSPKLFLKHAKSIILESKRKLEPPPPKFTGRDRNRSCSCGSGKKYKNCCGK